jgi:DNA polymerase-1
VLRPLLEDPAVLKIGQNIKYDCLVLRRHGITPAPIDDTMLLNARRQVIYLLNSRTIS